MPTDLIVVCPECNAPNRVPGARLTERPTCGQCKQPLFCGKPVDLDAASLERHLARNDLPLVIDFWAPWCGPCRMMAAAFEQATQAIEPAVRMAKLNTEAHPAVAARFNIRSIPTLALFLNGVEIARRSGAVDAKDLQSWIQTNLSRR